MSWMCFLVLGRAVLRASMKPVVKSQPVSWPHVTVCLLDNLLSLLLSSLPPSKSSSSLLSPLPLFTKSTQGLVSHSLCGWARVNLPLAAELEDSGPRASQVVKCTFLPSLKSANVSFTDFHWLYELGQPRWEHFSVCTTPLESATKTGSWCSLSLAARSIFVSDNVLAPGVCRGPGNWDNADADLVPTPVLSEMAPSASGGGLDTDLLGNARANWVSSGWWLILLPILLRVDGWKGFLDKEKNSSLKLCKERFPHTPNPLFWT